MKACLALLVFLSTFLVSNLGCAEIFQCVDVNGKVSFSDQECENGKAFVKKVEPIVNVIPSEDASDVVKGPKTIYTGKAFGNETRFVKVQIHEETDSYIIFYVEGYFSGPKGAKAEFRVAPNIQWRANSFSTTDIGKSSGYARVGMNSKENDIAYSDVVRLSLWLYEPDDNGKLKARYLDTKVVPYKKKWVRPEN